MEGLTAATAWAWQRSWDRQQEGYLPDREHRFAAMLDTVEACAQSREPTILDLAGGTGSISIRVLRRFPAATTTLVNVDPVLLTIARGSLDRRTTVVSADLRSAQWTAALPHPGYDAVLTATALHWIPEDRLAELYAEVRGVLHPGGLFINADHMPDDNLPSLNKRVGEFVGRRRDADHATGATVGWEDWWGFVERDPDLASPLVERRHVFDGWHGAEFVPGVGWHLEALRRAGFSEAGLIWRGGPDAAVAAVA